MLPLSKRATANYVCGIEWFENPEAPALTGREHPWFVRGVEDARTKYRETKILADSLARILVSVSETRVA